MMWFLRFPLNSWNHEVMELKGQELVYGHERLGSIQCLPVIDN